MSKRILFVMNTLGRAGAETALMELLGRLEISCEIDLYVLMGQGELVSKLPPGVRLLNKSFSDCSVFSAKGRLRMAGMVIKAMLNRATVVRLIPYLCRNIWAMLKKGRVQTDKLFWRVLSDGGMRISREYDLAVAFLEGGAAYYVADHVKARKKAAFIHIDYEQAGYTRSLDRDCYLQFDALFPIAEEIRDKLLMVYPECADRTQVFHNLINREVILEKSVQGKGFTDGYTGTRILTVGRLNSQKSYPVAIRAMKLLKDAGCRARWYVLGEGELRGTLERQIKVLGLENDFRLLGAVENPYPYYAQTDVYVHATRFEGRSIAIQEAQTLGRPVVASDCNGNRQQITPGVDGLLCPLEAEALAGVIEELLGDEGRRRALGDGARAKKVPAEDLGKLLELLE